MTETNEEIYLEKILKGDVNAYSFIVDKYKNMVFSLAFKMTKSREEAEEISQDTFIKAYKNLSKFKGESKFSTWLYRIAYHTTLDAIKKNKNSSNTFEITEVTFNHIKSTETILEGIERKERSKIIDKCLLKLADEERTIIWMFYYDELSLKEIIQVTGISEANLKVKLHRARKKLLKIVKDNVEPEMIINYGRK